MLKILLVDDNPDFLSSMETLLSLAGHDVATAADATLALSMLTPTSPITVMITDVVMPGLNGFQLADRAKAVLPQLCVIYITGYSADQLPPVESLHGSLLLKPCPFDRISEEIDSCAARAAAGPRLH